MPEPTHFVFIYSRRNSKNDQHKVVEIAFYESPNTPSTVLSVRTIADQDTSFEPHEQRPANHTISNLATFCHLLKSALGVGVLAMPKAYSEVGWIVGLVLSLFVTMLCVHGIHLLTNAQYLLCKRNRVPFLTYPKAVRAGFRAGPRCLQCLQSIAVPFVDTLLILYQLGICAVYVVFLGTNLQLIVEYYSTDTELDVRIYILAFLLPLLLIMFVRNLSTSAPLSAVANFLMIVGLCIVMYYVLEDTSEYGGRDMAAKPFYVPQFVAILLFALESVGVIVAIESSMRKPKSFPGFCGMFNSTMWLVGVICALIGLLGYWRYGDHVGTSIIFSMDEKFIPVRICRVLFMLAIILSYGLHGNVVVDVVWNSYMERRKVSFMNEFCVRFGVVVCSVLLALAMVEINVLIGIVGSLMSFLGIIVPALMDVCVHHPDAYGRMKYRLLRDILMILCGILLLFLGIASSIYNLTGI